MKRKSSKLWNKKKDEKKKSKNEMKWNEMKWNLVKRKEKVLFNLGMINKDCDHW